MTKAEYLSFRLFHSYQCFVICFSLPRSYRNETNAITVERDKHCSAPSSAIHSCSVAQLILAGSRLTFSSCFTTPPNSLLLRSPTLLPCYPNRSVGRSPFPFTTITANVNSIGVSSNQQNGKLTIIDKNKSKYRKKERRKKKHKQPRGGAKRKMGW